MLAGEAGVLEVCAPARTGATVPEIECDPPPSAQADIFKAPAKPRPTRSLFRWRFGCRHSTRAGAVRHLDREVQACPRAWSGGDRRARS